uniref:Phosphoinositide phospholipase C n=1 Tax=Dunaliella salina TaxID=3046 RepID=V5NY16_DUNSA|nr:PLC protein [Dunaliella salina]
MKNKLFEWELGDWDPHPQISQAYEPLPDEPHDMTQPPAHYFISSGHNSYLSGNQLWSRSTNKVIIKSLQESCRVIELDCYNQQLGFSGPIVKHGGTLTAPISFKSCVEAIGANAFKASPYPVVVTLENHTDTKNQKMMASILRQVLGDKLYIPTEEDRHGDWKSPEQLKGKVIIRANAGSACDELKSVVYLINVKFKSLEEANASESATTSSFNEYKVDALTTKAFKHSNISTDGVTNTFKAQAGIPGEAKVEETAKSSKGAAYKKQGQAQDGSAESGAVKQGNSFLVTTEKGETVELHTTHHSPAVNLNMIRAIKKVDDKNQQEREEAEKKKEQGEARSDDIATQVVQTVGTLQDMYNYTSRHLMRVYPGGLRVSSTNYDPSNAWTLGASFAALNWQTSGTSRMLNQAKFSVNNKTGYVLKPSWMRQRGPSTMNPLPHREPRRLCVTIFCAHVPQAGQWLCFKDDMYVALRVRGMPMDCQDVESAAVWNSGRLLLNQKFYFDIHFPEMAQLALQLKDDDLPGTELDDILGTFACPISTLNPGLWKINLIDTKGRRRQYRWLKVGFEWLDEAPTSANGIANRMERAASPLYSC